MSLTLHIGGARGTCPAAGPQFEEFGGDTSAFLVESPKTQLIVDAGTGLRHLVPKLRNTGNGVTLLLSHYHLDHLQGMMVYPGIYAPTPVNILVPDHLGDDPAATLNRIFAPPFWPVGLSEQPSIHIAPLGAEATTLGDIEVSWMRVTHPGGSTAFRFRQGQSVLALVCDTELGQAEKEERRELERFVKGADLLVIDGQYATSDYSPFRGWGHGTWQQAVDLARKAEVEQLVISHHGPRNDDALLRSREAEMKSCFPASAFARPGVEWTVGE